MTPARPLVVVLPGGAVVEDIDTTIPDDLADTWHWHGSFLSDGEVGIFTGTFGIEGAFAQARIHMRLRAEWKPEPVQLALF